MYNVTYLIPIRQLHRYITIKIEHTLTNTIHNSFDPSKKCKALHKRSQITNLDLLGATWQEILFGKYKDKNNTNM